VDFTDIPWQNTAISELNSRKSLVWADLRISATGYQNDAQLIPAVDCNFGTDYVWQPGHPVGTGGTLTFKGETIVLIRKQSDVSQPAVWR